MARDLSIDECSAKPLIQSKMKTSRKTDEEWSDDDWVAALKEAGQSHLFLDGAGGSAINRLITQIRQLNKSTPGGVLHYIQRAKKLLHDSKNNVNAFEGLHPEPPQGVGLVVGTEPFGQMEQIGMEQLPLTCFVLVAGGLGERLGYPDIKIGLPTDLSTAMSYMEWFANNIIAYQNFSSEQLLRVVTLPLAIMTSDDTDANTRKLLEDNDYFGLHKDQVTLLKQGKVPAMADSDARLSVTPQDPYTIETKPHGHGDVHSLLLNSRLPMVWNEKGFKWIVFFQDTNALVFRAIPSVLGVSADRCMFMNTIAIPRKPGEAVGALCRMIRNGGESSVTVNVEYNQLDALLTKSGNNQGDTPDPETGNSRFPGNTNCFVVHIPKYVDLLQRSGGVIPEFVNPKYEDSDRHLFKSPARLECMMQEIPKLANATDFVGFSELARWFCFSTVKNNRIDAAKKAIQNVPSESAFSAEADQYSNSARLLRMAAIAAGCCPISIPDPVPTTYGGVPYEIGPRVILKPSFGITFEEIKNRLVRGRGKPLRISHSSTVILEGDVRIEGLTVSGTFIAKAEPGQFLKICNMDVKNQGWELVQLTKEEDSVSGIVPDQIKIRGYRIVHHAQTIAETGREW